MAKCLHDLYEDARRTPSDMCEHVPMLNFVGKLCNHITEFGTRYGCSTIAFLNSRPKKMVSYDIVRQPQVDEICQAAKTAGLDYDFIIDNTLELSIDETDLLFIDTDHNYWQLMRELEHNVEKVRKFIILHDTVTFGFFGTGGQPGLLAAVEKILFQKNSPWYLVEHFWNCHGLAIFARKDL